LKIQLKQKNAQAFSGLHIQQSSALKKQKIQKQFQASLIIFFDWIIFPAKLRFENTIKIKKRSSELGVFSFDCIYS
jgi:hypothetical protein